MASPQGTDPDSLGPEVLRCRPLPPGEWLRLRYGGVAVNFWFPCVYFPVVALWSASGPWLVVQHQPRPVALGVFWGAAALVYAVMTWWYYVRPDWDHLVVYRDGLRCRLGSRVNAVRWDELAAVTRGGAVPGGEAVVAFLDRVSPRAADLHRAITASAVRFHLAGGRPWFGVPMIRFDPADGEQFLAYLREHHAELIEVA